MLESFYREYYGIVYGYLLSLCGEPEEAEELTAATFLKAVEQIKRNNSRYSPSTWLCTIGRNLYYSDRRKRKRLRPLEEAEDCAVPSAEAVFLQREDLRHANAVLRSLPVMQRQVCIMRLQGSSFREIGIVLGKTENWARVTYYRVKQKIIRETEGTE